MKCIINFALLLTVYDDKSQIIAKTDQNNQTTSYEYDSRGRLTDVIDAKQYRTEYGYDLAGNLVSAKDANGRVTAYEYDERDRRTATILPLLRREETTYDAVGNVIKKKDFNQNTINYSYDSNNRLIGKQFIDGKSVTYTYTKTGQVETIADSRGVTTYKYDERDRLISRTDPSGLYLNTGATIEYEYDAAGNHIAVKTKAEKTSHTYDELNRLKTATENTDTTTYFYDAVGNLCRAPEEETGDFPSFLAQCLVFNEKSWKLLQPLIADAIEALPLISTDGRNHYITIKVLDLVDCLDYSQSVYRQSAGGFIQVSSYVFQQEDSIVGKHIFWLPKAYHAVVSEEFKNLVEQNQLKGLIFKKLC